ncbi:hypothetical protein PCASD_06259 [Puccinia coronata f. sp. avenae]|uniref:Uncharacterized protein n=1 Tax=Puccinia coronata f. sp. avenae TaxID=200324 RepID=A0A2N5V6E3_9BASI|nr:hypothetical protein PCASD_06259 [Puccinia coronata f. sp. avenae]
MQLQPPPAVPPRPFKTNKITTTLKLPNSNSKSPSTSTSPSTSPSPSPSQLAPGNITPTTTITTTTHGLGLLISQPTHTQNHSALTTPRSHNYYHLRSTPLTPPIQQQRLPQLPNSHSPLSAVSRRTSLNSNSPFKPNPAQQYYHQKSPILNSKPSNKQPLLPNNNNNNNNNHLKSPTPQPPPPPPPPPRPRPRSHTTANNHSNPFQTTPLPEKTPPPKPPPKPPKLIHHSPTNPSSAQIPDRVPHPVGPREWTPINNNNVNSPTHRSAHSKDSHSINKYFITPHHPPPPPSDTPASHTRPFAPPAQPQPPPPPPPLFQSKREPQSPLHSVWVSPLAH